MDFTAKAVRARAELNARQSYGGSMSHEWVYDVLRDLKSYAEANGLLALAAKAEEALRVAQVEIAALDDSPPPKGKRQH